MALNNIAVTSNTSDAVFTPITINSLDELKALLENPPETETVQILVTLKTKAAVANLLGALIAYGTANVYAENGLKSIGLGDFYTGNVRGAARDYATQIAVAADVRTPDFDEYLHSVKFRQSVKSKAGAAVIGTEEDLAPGYAPTHFEPALPASVVEDAEPEVEDEYEAEEVGTTEVW